MPIYHKSVRYPLKLSMLRHEKSNLVENVEKAKKMIPTEVEKTKIDEIRRWQKFDHV